MADSMRDADLASDRAPASASVVPPGPGDGSLTLSVECTATPGARFGAVHEVRIETDWTVRTPHDIQAERIAAALGSWVSCVDLVERVIPTVRHVLEAMACGRGLEPGQLDEHTGAGSDRIASLLRQARAAWVTQAETGLVEQGARGWSELWDLGLHPTLVRQLAHLVPRHLLPLPTAFFRDAARSGVDHRLLARTVGLLPDREVAFWAVQRGRGLDGAAIEEAATLRELGLQPRDALLALETGIDSASIRHFALARRVTTVSAVRLLAFRLRAEQVAIGGSTVVVAGHPATAGHPTETGGHRTDPTPAVGHHRRRTS